MFNWLFLFILSDLNFQCNCINVDGIIFLDNIDDGGELHLNIIHRLNIKDKINIIEFQSNVLYQIRPDYLSTTSFNLCIRNAEVIDLYFKEGEVLEDMKKDGSKK